MLYDDAVIDIGIWFVMFLSFFISNEDIFILQMKVKMEKRRRRRKEKKWRRKKKASPLIKRYKISLNI